MDDLHLQADDDHVQRLAHENDPVRAIVELVWNAIDGEADTVQIDLQRNEAGGIVRTIVADDGHGISEDELESTFGRIGGSWKRNATRTKNRKRGLHGARGEGRLRAFALGNRVSWVSHSKNTGGELRRVTISGDAARRHIFSRDVRPAAEQATGTVVTAENEAQRSLGTLEADRALPILLSHFAPLLLDDATLNIVYDGIRLDPKDEIVGEPVSFRLHFEDDTAVRHRASVRIIEWKSGSHRAIYYGRDQEHFLFEESARDIEPSFRFSAYVTWSGLDHDALSIIGLGEMAQGPVGALWTAARTSVREHFARRRRADRREQVTKWKQQNVYPYEGEPSNEAEKAERAVFDVVSGTLSAQISPKKADAKLALALLRDAIRHDPDRLTTIIHEVAALNDGDRSTLTQLLGETTLPAIIRAANLVTSRNKFLLGLEHLLFDPTDAGTVGERDHLHRILERELWVFGEAYHLMNRANAGSPRCSVHTFGWRASRRGASSRSPAGTDVADVSTST